MPRTIKTRLGSGAVCDCLVRFLHPRGTTNTKYPNAHHKQRIDDLLAIKTVVKKMNNKEQMCFIFNHTDFDDTRLYCVLRYAKVLTEGDESGLFQKETSTEIAVAEEVLSRNEEDGDDIPMLVGELSDDMARLRAEGYGVDDDNEPTPENLPFARTLRVNVEFKEWNSQTTCNRRAEGLH